jgi:hypothetical protein
MRPGFWGIGTGGIQHRRYGLPGIPLPGTWVNKGHSRPEAGYRGGADMCNATMARSAPPHSFRSEATHSLAQLLRPFVVTFYVYTSNQKPEEKWKFPNNRTYANNPGKYLCVVGEKKTSIAMY